MTSLVSAAQGLQQHRLSHGGPRRCEHGLRNTGTGSLHGCTEHPLFWEGAHTCSRDPHAACFPCGAVRCSYTPQPRLHPSPQGLEEVRTRLGISEWDPDEPELSMPEPALLSVDKKAAEKKRAEKVGAKGSTAGLPGRCAGKPFSAPKRPAWPQVATEA